MRRLLSIALFASLTSCSSYYIEDDTVVLVLPDDNIEILDSKVDVSYFNDIPSASIESVEVDTGFSEQKIFITSLAANQEVNIDPSIHDSTANLNASAVGLLVINTETKTLSGNVTFENIDLDDAVTHVSLQASAAGSNGPTLLELAPSKTDPQVFNIPLGTKLHDLAGIIGTDLSTLLSAGWYFNLKTKRNPAGQLRGQIVPNDIDVIRVELEAEQQIPRVTKKSGPNVSAVGYFTYNKVDASVYPIANVIVRGFEAIQVNLHCGGLVGKAGPVKIPLNDVSPADFPGTLFTSNTKPIASLTALKRGTYYFNALSSLNPHGELRGQIVTSALPFELNKTQDNSNLLIATQSTNYKVTNTSEFTVNAANPLVFPVSNVSVSSSPILPSYLDKRIDKVQHNRVSNNINRHTP
jgi:hypothetical protein